MKIIAAAVLAAAAVAGVWVAQPQSYFDPNADFLASCEAHIRERLKAPSTYLRTDEPMVEVVKISADRAVALKASGIDDQAYRDLMDRFRRLYEEQGAFEHRAIIQYEAANSFGTPIANISECQIVSIGETLSDADLLDPVIDGQTNTQRLIDALD